jgi:hypothetical protein
LKTAEITKTAKICISIFPAVYDDVHNLVVSQQDMSSRQISVQQLGENNSQGDHRRIFKVKKTFRLAVPKFIYVLLFL